MSKTVEIDMRFNDYQTLSQETALPSIGKDKPVAMPYALLGLSSEVGEVSSLFKKQMRDGGKVSEEALEKELGDVLWYVARICELANLQMGDVAAKNLNKLSARKAAGTIGGSGDNR